MGKRVSKSFYRPSWKDHFTFTLKERRGFLVLLFLLATELVVLAWLRYRSVPVSDAEWLALVRKADSVLNANSSDSPWLDHSNSSVRSRDTLFHFNPNTCSLSAWTALGLSEKQAQAVKRYVEQGGRFRSKSDVTKMRVIPGRLFEAWKPYILLPDSAVDNKHFKDLKYSSVVELNSADSAQIDRLPGVGSFMAGRIIKYRQRLGGYWEVAQLLEVYGMTDSLYNKLQSKTFCDSALLLRKLGLNSTPFDSLGKHPYVGFNLAKMIDRYRIQHPFSDAREVLQLPLVTPEIFRKLAPYLTIR